MPRVLADTDRRSERHGASRQAPPTAGAVPGSLRAQRTLSGRMQNDA